MKNLFLSVLSSVFFSVLLFSCDTGSGNIQGHIDLNLIEHLEGKDLGGTTVKIKGRNEVAVTDIDGNFTLKNVEAGTFTLTISRDDWDTKETKIKVENGKIASLNETLDYSFAIIAGNLTGMPSSYMISLLKKDDESVNYQQITSSDFMIARIDQGSYKVTLTDSNSGSLVAAFQLDVPKNWYHFFTDIYNDEYLQSDNDETQFKKVTAGESHTCGIKEDGTLFCWGDNKYGQIGIGITGGYAAVPTKIGYDKWSDISAGGWHTCGIQEDGTLYCWGKNEFGGLGDGSYDDKPVPTKIDDSSWVEISAGGDHTCGIKNDNSLYCWGRSIEGQVGNERSGLGADESVPVKIGEEEWRLVSAGSLHTCGIRNDSSLYCWGDNRNGQLGDGTSGINMKKTVPEKIGNDSWIDVRSGKGKNENHTCGIRKDSSLYCWGSNDHGQLGDGTNENSFVPVKIGNEIWLNVTTGSSHTCSISSENEIFCWGENSSGQLGDGTKYDSNTMKESLDGIWSSVFAGTDHTCAVSTAKKLYCWGANGNSQLGDGTNDDRTEPVFIIDPF